MLSKISWQGVALVGIVAGATVAVVIAVPDMSADALKVGGGVVAGLLTQAGVLKLGGK